MLDIVRFDEKRLSYTSVKHLSYLPFLADSVESNVDLKDFSHSAG